MLQGLGVELLVAQLLLGLEDEVVALLEVFVFLVDKIHVHLLLLLPVGDDATVVIILDPPRVHRALTMTWHHSSGLLTENSTVYLVLNRVL